MSEPGPISYRREGGVGILSLNRPDKLNAMTHAMGDALSAQVAAIAADPAVRCLVLRGEGRAFSAGGDLDFLETNRGRGMEENKDDMAAFYGKFLSVRELPMPTLALLQGRATGAGLCLALGCDLRLAASDALLSVNFVKIGLTPGMAGTWHLPRLVGPAKAAELLFTGRAVTGDEALAMGLVNAVHPAESLLDEGLAMARLIAEAAPEAVRETKALLRASATLSLADGLEAEASAQARAFAGAELGEGIAAIRERRAARY